MSARWVRKLMHRHGQRAMPWWCTDCAKSLDIISCGGDTASSSGDSEAAGSHEGGAGQTCGDGDALLELFFLAYCPSGRSISHENAKVSKNSRYGLLWPDRL